jgi:radical SAM superfamily enzyme YgiQ (UPF0313 family)
MKILLVNPPFQRLKGIAQTYFPLGLGYLCAVLSSDKRVDAMIYNAETPNFSERLPFHIKYQDMLNLHNRYINSLQDDHHYVWQEIYEVIKDFNPDIVGISVMTAKYGSSLKISKIAKSVNKNCKVIWGGPHATVDSERVLENNAVDFVVRGEGEITLKDLIDLLVESKDNFRDDLSRINGLSYKIDSKVFHNPDRAFIEDLDTLAFPEKEKVFFSNRYLPSSWGDIITSRGCPFNCGYCSAPNIWTYKVRYRSIQKILEEIDAIISKYNTKEFYFWDDNLTLNRDRTLKFCRLLKQNRMRISWGCTTRVDLLDDLIVKEMKQAGCSYISIGIETGSDRILKNIHKGISLEEVNLAVNLLNKYRLKYEAFFMVGFPEETQEDIKQTVNFMKQLKNAKICLSIFTPYPCTEQYEIARRYKLISESPDWSQFSHQSQANHFMKYITQEQFKKNIEEISSWVDKNNSRNIDLGRLFWNACLNLDLLIRKPKLIINKFKTLSVLISHKAKVLFRFAQGRAR